MGWWKPCCGWDVDGIVDRPGRLSWCGSVIKQFVDRAPCFAGLSGREHVREALRIRGFQLR